MLIDALLRLPDVAPAVAATSTAHSTATGSARAVGGGDVSATGATVAETRAAEGDPRSVNT